jgi:predicted metalloprotease
MATTRPASAPRRPALGLRAVAALGLVVTVAAIAAGWAWGRVGAAGSPARLALSAGGAEAIVRRTEVAFADAEAVWRRALHARGGGYDPARLVFFARATESPCAGGGIVSGPFYCPETGTATFDLAFLDALGGRLQKERDLGLALYAARLAAEHLQHELGLLDAAALELIGSPRGERRAVGTRLALQADCLAGVWAAAAEPRIGPVPEGLYGQMVWSSRNLVADLAREGVHVPWQLDPLAAGRSEERAAAFDRGYRARAVDGCIG